MCALEPWFVLFQMCTSLIIQSRTRALIERAKLEFSKEYPVRDFIIIDWFVNPAEHTTEGFVR